MVNKSVNIDNIRHNIITLKNISKNKFCAVVKANAYGHGIEICRGIDDLVDFYAVATTKEAITLKALKIKKHILLLGKYDSNFLSKLVKKRVRLTIDSFKEAEELIRIATSLERRTYVHIKINTGMNRLGTRSKTEFQKIYQLLKSCKFIKIEGIYTHFATADSPNSYKLKRQNAKFLSILDCIPKKERNGIIIHASNSSAFVKSPKYAYDMVRVGIGMYGYDQIDRISLKPALNIGAKIIKVLRVNQGESISYNAEFVAKADMLIAVLGIGYGDGYLRAYQNGYVLIKGHKCRVVGRICMDMLMCDISCLSDTLESDFKESAGGGCKLIGEYAVILGVENQEEINARDLAKLSNTTEYEVLTNFNLIRE